MPDLKKHFNNDAAEYDSKVEQNIPRYNEMLEALINAIPDNKDEPRILDLGCGTGNITKKVLERFPKAQITCLDLSENMLEIAKDKLSQYENIDYILNDFTTLDIYDDYDAIISSLALHHIETDEKKLEMYKKIYDALKEGGVFYNADVLKANSTYNENLNNNTAYDIMRQKGVNEEEIDIYKNKRDENDVPTTLINHIKMLEQAGFKQIDVIWKFYGNGVYGGKK